MKEITVKRIYSECETRKFKGKKPNESHYDILVDTDTHVKDENGETIAILVNNATSKQNAVNYYKVITKTGAIRKTLNRGMSSGKKPVKHLKKDGTLSNTAKPEEGVESSIIGFYDRYPRNNYCRKTSWTLENQPYWDLIYPYIKEVNDVYKNYAPDYWNKQNETASITSKDFIIKDTVFTTITLNRNFRTFYHEDAGNLKKGLGVMTYLKRGKFSGGELIIPSHRIAFRFKNLDLIIFNNNILHGNTEIKSINNDFERITSVFYYREKMIFCGTAEQELERAKRNKGDQVIGSTTENLNERYNPEC